MKRRVAALAAFILLAGCSTALTQSGADIRIVEDKEANNCEFIATVSAFDTLGASTGHESQNALNEARNKAAQAGGNAIKIVHMQTTFQGTSVTAEALRCEFSGDSR
jgi:ABC-type glycerol-3-phosphate transport system substrate-binding protein